MTACVAIKVDGGIVLASDSRTNAGVDYVRTYSKMHTFNWPGDRTLVILTSGNLATTQAVINRVNHDLDDKNADFNLRKAKKLFEIAHYIGSINQQEQAEHAKAFKDNHKTLEANFIVGGQIGEEEDDIYLVYPEGNYITVSPETPYMQIGETKYGKPILDRIITPKTSLNDAARCALVSLDSTMRSNVSVGPPLELAIYTANSLTEPRYTKIDLSTPLFTDIQNRWAEGLQQAFQNLPRFDWED
ncbi:peptidase [Sulfuriflexus mobilis]|uniref:peptidase n=1 Tax=Sulfuriflexus mobilis TaxID=1811807 RepID=UPI000F84E78E|nr:peptidase [Sulfuriflexus mobilis]